MRRFLNISILAIGLFYHSEAQIPFERCGHMKLMDQAEKLHPGYLQAVGSAFSSSKSALNQRTGDVLRIPMVFHVVWNGLVQAQNIPDSVIIRQVEILNESFRAKNPDKDQLRAVFGLGAADAEIEFYLADIDPDGNPSNGIVRKSTTKKFSINPLSGGINIDMKSAIKGGSDPWPTEKYMNVWVVNMPLSFFGQEQIAVLGFATPPADLPNWPSNALDGIGADGVVMQFQFIGDNNETLKSLPVEFSFANRGRALVHETGHYLGLRHIWADKGNPLLGTPSCTNAQGIAEDDGMEDTPYCGGNSQTDGCDPEKNTCDENNPDLPDMWENYMDYSEERCQVLFTPDQSAFMRNTLETKRKTLISWNSGPTGTKTIPSGEVNIFPNPANEVLQVVTNPNILISRIVITDLLGRQITFDKNDIKTANQIKINSQAQRLHIIRVFNTAGKIIAEKKILLGIK